MIKIILAGFYGKMGQAAIDMIHKNDQFQLVAVYGPHASAHTELVPELNGKDIFEQLSDDFPSADVWVDLSIPSAVFENVQFALNRHLTPVVGTTGLKDDQVQTLTKLSEEEHLGGLIVPNFSLSAVLLMQFAKQAAKYFPNAEVIEIHHEDKLDAPSGTALRTASLIEEGRTEAPINLTNVEEQPARGQLSNSVPIHAVRLPGYVAHEQVLFGSKGEALTIRQDSFSRDAFMPGLELAILKVSTLKELTIGLENIL